MWNRSDVESVDMVSKSRQLVERPSGTGKISRDNEEIGTATYLLDVVQSIQAQPIYRERREGIPNRQEVRGQLRVVDGQADLREGIFTLELTDGRRWEFFATKGDPDTGSYTVVRGLW
tara:strand:+ start:554 stop:907 length:354 start_codon:yes stop_codon:yes gene_type:complete